MAFGRTLTTSALLRRASYKLRVVELIDARTCIQAGEKCIRFRDSSEPLATTRSSANWAAATWEWSTRRGNGH